MFKLFVHCLISAVSKNPPVPPLRRKRLGEVSRSSSLVLSPSTAVVKGNTPQLHLSQKHDAVSKCSFTAVVIGRPSSNSRRQSRGHEQAWYKHLILLSDFGVPRSWPETSEIGTTQQKLRLLMNLSLEDAEFLACNIYDDRLTKQVFFRFSEQGLIFRD